MNIDDPSDVVNIRTPIIIPKMFIEFGFLKKEVVSDVRAIRYAKKYEAPPRNPDSAKKFGPACVHQK